MHIKGTPQNMQLSPTYKDLMGEIHSFLKSRIVDLVSAGIDEKSIIIDPGFGSERLSNITWRLSAVCAS